MIKHPKRVRKQQKKVKSLLRPPRKELQQLVKQSKLEAKEARVVNLLNLSTERIESE